MKLKKEDFGLYFALTLLGGGIGLLGGVIVSSKLKPKEVTLTGTVVEYNKINKMGETFAPGSVDINYDAVEFRHGIDKAKKSVKKKSNKKEIPDDLAEFLEEWKPNNVQIQMLLSGAATIDEIKNVILQTQSIENAAGEYNYAKPYFDILQDTEVKSYESIINERYRLREDEPDDGDPKRLKVFYLNDDGQRFYRKTRNGATLDATKDVDKILDAKSQNLIKGFLMSGVHRTLFLEDTQTIKWWRFELIPLDDQGDSDDVDEDIGT